MLSRKFYDRDWPYTKANLGISDPTEDQKEAVAKLAELGLVLVPRAGRCHIY